MVNVWKILRSATLGNRPSGGALTAGAPYVNFAEKQFGVIDSTPTPQDLIGVPFFSTSASYSTGQPVVYLGQLYVATANVTAGAWNSTNWSLVGVGGTASPLMNGTAAAGTSTSYARQDHIHPTDTSRAAQASLANYLLLTGGTLTGGLTGTTLTLSSSFFGNGLNPSYSANSNFSINSTSNVVNINLFGAGVYAIQQNYTAGLLSFIGASTVGITFDYQGSIVTYGAGNLTIAGQGYKPAGGSWGSTSDARIKTVDGEYTRGLDTVVQLQPKIFTFKGNDTNDPPSNLQTGETPEQKAALEAPYPNSPNYNVALTQKRFTGFVAQDVEGFFPELVTERAGYIDGVAVSDLRDIDTTPLIYALVNAVKELAARVAALEAP